MLLKDEYLKEFPSSCWPSRDAPASAREAVIHFCVQRLNTPIDHVHPYDLLCTTLCQRVWNHPAAPAIASPLLFLLLLYLDSS
jgi:hypothetical protein